MQANFRLAYKPTEDELRELSCFTAFAGTKVHFDFDRIIHSFE
jgi:hypothetical protein